MGPGAAGAPAADVLGGDFGFEHEAVALGHEGEQGFPGPGHGAGGLGRNVEDRAGFGGAQHHLFAQVGGLAALFLGGGEVAAGLRQVARVLGGAVGLEIALFGLGPGQGLAQFAGLVAESGQLALGFDALALGLHVFDLGAGSLLVDVAVHALQVAGQGDLLLVLGRFRGVGGELGGKFAHAPVKRLELGA